MSWQSGISDIVIGRDDGTLEIWDVDENGTPHQVFLTQIHESINTVDGGNITSPTANEIAIQTFSGKV